MSHRSLVQDTIADLKRRKELMLGTHQSQSIATVYNHNSSYSIVLVEENLTKREKNCLNNLFEVQKCLVIHVDSSFLDDDQKKSLFQGFLEAYLKQKQLYQLSQIKIFDIGSSRKHSNPSIQLQNSEQRRSQSTEIKLLKMNLKYCLHPKNNRVHSHDNENFVNVYIFPTSSAFNQPENLKMVGQLVDWRSNPYILIAEDTYSNNQNTSYQLYFSLLQSFSEHISYVKNQRSLHNSHKLVPPISLITKLNDLIEENVFSCSKGLLNFMKLCELQYNLFKAESELKIKQSKENFRDKFIQTYTVKLLKVSIGQITKFTRFYKKKQANLKIKYFNLWSFVTCQSLLRKIDNEIIDHKYCQQKYQKELMQKAFTNWKLNYLNAKEQHA